MGGKHCGKRIKCWFPAFSPFPTMFSKGLFFRVIKSRDCVIKGQVIMPTYTETMVDQSELMVDDGQTNTERKRIIFNITPVDGARCTVIIDTQLDPLSIGFPVKKEFELIIGEGKTEHEEMLENALFGVKKGTSVEVIIRVPVNTGIELHKQTEVDEHDVTNSQNGNSSGKVTVTLLDFQNPPTVCDYTRKEKFEFAKYHKTQGIELYKSENHRFAYKHFSKALKFLLLMLPMKDIPTELQKDFDVMRCQCYSNMAACLLKEKQYEAVVENCSKCLGIDEKYMKAIYRRAEAFIHLQKYIESKEDIMLGLRFDPNSKAFLKLSQKLSGQ